MSFSLHRNHGFTFRRTFVDYTRFLYPAIVMLLFILCQCASSPVQDASDLRLVPFPKEVMMDQGAGFSLKTKLQLRISAKDKDVMVTQLVDELKRAGFPEPQLTAFDSDMPCLMLTKPESTPGYPSLPDQTGKGQSDTGESYAMTVSPNGIVCLGKSENGLYYAVQTLRQLIRANTDANSRLPYLTIRDWPSMKYRSFQDDWTRGPSSRLHALFGQFETGSYLKHNMFTYYMENQFEYKKHPKISPKDGTMTQDEFKQCIEYATKRHLILLGNQQSFGHHEKILALPEYAHLGEAGYILSPTVEEVYTFLDDLYSEILPLLPFKMFNVCCDETADLAKSGPSKILADEIGVAGVYVKHILRVRELLQKYDKRMLMWGDIIMHHPDKLSLIPKDVVMMCWDYELRADYDRFIKPFSESGYEFFVCPGYSSWSVLLPQVKKYTVNIQNFVRDGCAHGAIGMLNTGWEDDGEFLHGYTWHAIAWGAECSWNASKTELADFNKRIGPALFGAKGDDFGRAIELTGELQVLPELGGAHNGAFNTLFWERDFIPKQTPDQIEKRANRILELIQPAIKHLEITKEQATINTELLEAFLFGAKRMELIGMRQLDGLEMSRRYTTASTLDLTDPAQKKTALNEIDAIAVIINKNRKAHNTLKTMFVQLWNRESKPYSLDRVTHQYDDLDAWFAELQQKLQDVRKTIAESDTEVRLPDIGLIADLPVRKTWPTRVVTHKLSPETPWKIAQALLRLGLTVEAGHVDRSVTPVELDIPLPESCIGKKVEAYMLDSGGGEPRPVPVQLDPANHPQNPKIQRLMLLVPAMTKETHARIYVYFGLDKTSVPFPTVTAFDGDSGMKVIENDLVQIHLGKEGGHAYKWIVKDFGTIDITNPGNDSYHGFSDHGSVERSKQFELVCLSRGPVMVRYGCYLDGELKKTMTVYAGLPVLEVSLLNPTTYYYDFNNPDVFAANGKMQGLYLFSTGTTGPTPTKGIDLQIREPGWPLYEVPYWAIKTNKQGLIHGLITPELPSRFAVGFGIGREGVGIERYNEKRYHFVTYAGMTGNKTPQDIMGKIRDVFNLKNQPVVTLYAQEQPLQ